MSRKFTLPAVLAALMTPSAAFAQAADPAGSGPIVAALGWLQGTLLGNVATAVAVMAVAAVGFMMLTGRLNWRFGATVIIGVFMHRNALRCIMIVRVFFRVVSRMAAVKIVAMGQVQIKFDIQGGEALNAVIFWLVMVAS